jgi:hypothetical protein
MPSTRYRDLVDLVSIATGASVPAADQFTALMSEFDRRQLHLPAAFDVPDRRLWEPGYAAEARRSLSAAGRTLQEALDVVKPFIDPLLSQSATGHWDPASRQWLGTTVDDLTPKAY